MSLIYNAQFDKTTRKLSFEDRAGNEIYSFTVPERGPAVDDITKPLTFKSTQDGSTVTLTKNGSPDGAFQTSRDGGNTWVDYTIGTAITLNTGDEVSFRANNNRTTNQDAQDYFYFGMTGKIEAWHNVMSLYRTNDFATFNATVSYAFGNLFKDCISLTKAPVLPATTLASECYSNMFKGCTSLTEAPELPTTTLTPYCYWGMFNGCTSLTNAPVLPATTLAGNCYSGMFYKCTSLTEAPELPTTTLTPYCYHEMFSGCTSLTKAPVLPATTLATNCYSDMFNGCTSLAESPALPATTLDGNCYSSMFKGCTSLTKAPELPATTLANKCYYSMFYGCTSLKKAPELPATTLAETCYRDMFHGCTSLVNAPELLVTTLAAHCYRDMFHGCTSLTKAPELPATTLDNYCYAGMFIGCTSLTKAPVLPATTLTNGCYYYMFDGCSSLNEVCCKISSSYIQTLNTDRWLNGVSATGTFYANENANWPSGASGIPENWTRINFDDITKPLTLKATQDGSTVALRKVGSPPTGEFQTSRDGGKTWADYTLGTAISLNTGEEVSFRAKANRTQAQSSQNYFGFQMTGKIEAWHNVMSLCRTSDFATYESMVGSGLRELFRGCQSLTKAPALPATTLARDCYEAMFYDCRSLKEVPELPATTLVYGCYSYMFWGCESLTKASALPATTLADYCYYIMFSGCRSLKEVRIAATTTTATSALTEWLSGVSATGDFYCDPNATIFPSGASGIPLGWTRRNIADYPNP